MTPLRGESIAGLEDLNTNDVACAAPFFATARESAPGYRLTSPQSVSEGFDGRIVATAAMPTSRRRPIALSHQANSQRPEIAHATPARAERV
jgi:hypothetical protein